MKNLAFILALFICTNAVAQVGPPNAFGYNGVARNPAGNAIPDQKIGVQFSILKSSSNGAVQYREFQVTTTDARGYFSLKVGMGSIQQGRFDTISWDSGSYYLQVGMDITGDTNYQTTGVTQLLSVPYALNAISVDSVIGSAPCALNHYLGELYGGGIIFYLWKSGGVEHGLIASLADLNDSIVWQTGPEPITTNAVSYDNGSINTDTILSILGPGTNYAAGLCQAYNGGGYTDWYLPAIWELYKLYDQAFLINSILNYDNDNATGGFNNLYDNGFFAYYWSSTEGNYITAWIDPFYSNQNGYNVLPKNQGLRVRAVRRF
jgi:hypothetical protein